MQDARYMMQVKVASPTLYLKPYFFHHEGHEEKHEEHEERH
jgi:hypothetical protein